MLLLTSSTRWRSGRLEGSCESSGQLSAEGSVTGKRKRDYFITVPDDGLLTYDVGPWAADKYRYVGMYAEMFATGMKNLWDRRVYLDLFSGPGS